MQYNILTPLIVLFLFCAQGCTSYDISTRNSDTLAGSISKLLKSDSDREKKQQESREAPVYVDYSKNNPLLRHEQGFDEDLKIQSDDPFEEKVTFSERQRIREIKEGREQQKNQENDLDENTSESTKKPISFW